MSATSLIERHGRSIEILAEPAHTDDKVVLVANKAGSPFAIESQKSALFKPTSTVARGSVFKDTVTNECYIVALLSSITRGDVVEVLRATVLKSQGQGKIKSLSKTSSGSFGKVTYAWTDRITDYACAMFNGKGDRLMAAGEMNTESIVVVISARNANGYVPAIGDRIQLADSSLFQVDAVDTIAYPGCYELTGSPDKR